MSKREQIVKWARWGVTNHGKFTYTMGPQRWHMVESQPGSLPQFADCSSFVTACARWAGCSDPNGEHFTGGYTGTLLAHCNHIPQAKAQPGDLIVYGPGTGHHVVLIVERVPGGIEVVSHGHQGTPELSTHAAQLTRQPVPATFLRWLDPHA